MIPRYCLRIYPAQSQRQLPNRGTPRIHAYQQIWTAPCRDAGIDVSKAMLDAQLDGKGRTLPNHMDGFRAIAKWFRSAGAARVVLEATGRLQRNFVQSLHSKGFAVCAGCRLKILERAMGFEPTTPTLARLCSTSELRPHPRRPFLDFRQSACKRKSRSRHNRDAECGDRNRRRNRRCGHSSLLRRPCRMRFRASTLPANSIAT